METEYIFRQLKLRAVFATFVCPLLGGMLSCLFRGLAPPWFGSSVICSVLENHQSAYRVSQPAGDRKIASVNGKIGQLDDRLH